MLEGELAKLKNCLAVQSDVVPVAFPNFTAAVVVSLFGAEINFHENGPVYSPVFTDTADIDRLAVPPLDGGLMPQIERAIDYFRERVPDFVEVTPPYIHTPLNSAALLRGPGEFYADLCLEPQRAHRLLSIVTETAAGAATRLFDHLGRPPAPFTNWMGIHLGDLVHISDDCCVNLSPDFITTFDLDYVDILSTHLGTQFCTHYCVMPRQGDLAEHCLEPTCACAATQAICNQYSPEYFLEHYDRFENRLALISQVGFPGIPLGQSRQERLGRFRDAAEDFLDRFQGKSGLILTCGAPTVEEARDLYSIWDSLCPWPEEAG